MFNMSDNVEFVFQDFIVYFSNIGSKIACTNVMRQEILNIFIPTFSVT